MFSREMESYTEQQRAFHVALLKDAGFVEAAIRTDENGFPNAAVTVRLTWAGYEFLRPRKDPKIWKAAKDAFSKHGAPLIASLVFEWLKSEARRLITGIPNTP